MPALLEPPQESFASATDRSRTFARRFLATTTRFLVVLILGAMAGGGWYLARKGFGRKWRELVVEELHKHGVEASVRTLTLDPYRGDQSHFAGRELRGVTPTPGLLECNRYS